MSDDVKKTKRRGRTPKQVQDNQPVNAQTPLDEPNATADATVVDRSVDQSVEYPDAEAYRVDDTIAEMRDDIEALQGDQPERIRQDQVEAQNEAPYQASEQPALVLDEQATFESSGADVEGAQLSIQEGQQGVAAESKKPEILAHTESKARELWPQETPEKVITATPEIYADWQKMIDLEMELEDIRLRLMNFMQDAAVMEYKGVPIETWKTVQSERFDLPSFREEYPRVYQEFKKTATSRALKRVVNKRKQRLPEE